MNNIRTLGGQTIIYGLSSIVPRFLNYLLTPLYVYLFLPEQYGNVTILYAYVTFVNIILTYGMESGFFFFARKEKDFSVVYGTAFLSLLFTTLLFIFLSLLNLHRVSNFLGYPNNIRYIFWFILILGCDTLTAIPFAKLRQQDKSIKFAIIRLLSVGFTVFFNLLLIWIVPKYFLRNGYFLGFHYKLDIELIFVANLLGSFITLIILLPDTVKERISFSFSLWKRMLNYSYPLLFAGLAGTINDTLDRFLLLHYLPSNVNKIAEIGIYGANIKIAVIMVLFTQMFRFAAEPFFYNQKKSSDQKAILAEVTKFFTMFGIIIFLFVMLYLDVIKYYINNKYWGGLNVVPINLISSFMLGIYFNLSFWYKLTGKTYYGILITSIGAVITIVLNIFVIPGYGYVGSAWVRLLCYFVMVLISYFWGQVHFPVRYPVNTLISYFGIGIIIYFICCNFKFSNMYADLFKNSVVLAGFILYLERREHLISIFIRKEIKEQI